MFAGVTRLLNRGGVTDTAFSTDGGSDGEEDLENLIDEVLARREEVAQKEQKEFIAFHTVCLGVKLSLEGNTARLRNVQITDLWEEARRKELPAAEWRTFVRAKLVAPPQQRRRETSIADEFRTALDALAAPFEALGDGISDVAKDVAKTEVWKTVETKCLPLQKRRPGRKALK
jgi:hypothetical protein